MGNPIGLCANLKTSDRVGFWDGLINLMMTIDSASSWLAADRQLRLSSAGVGLSLLVPTFFPCPSQQGSMFTTDGLTWSI